MSNLKSGMFFFENICEKYKIYLFLYNFGISDFIKLPVIIADLSLISDYYNCFSDAKKLKIVEVFEIYKEIYKRGEEEKNEKYLTLSYLIDKDAFNKRINEIKAIYNPVYDIDAERKRITGNYTDKIHKAETKSEIEKLLQIKEHEINRLYDKYFWDVLNKIAEFNNKYGYGVQKNKYSDFEYEPNFFGKKIDLLSYSHLRVVDDVNAEIGKLEEAIKKELYNLSNPNEIMKAKDRFKKEIAQLVSVEDFIFTVRNLKISELNYDRFLHLLGKILIEINNIEIKKIILYMSAKSKNNNWLKYLHRLGLNSNLHFFLFEAIKNKYSSSNLL